MGIFSRFTRPKYEDERIASRAQVAINEDPLLTGSEGLTVVSEKGVVTLTGVVHKEPERDRVEGDIRATLRDAGLKYDRIENKIEVRQLA